MKFGLGLLVLALMPVAGAESSSPQFQRDVLPIFQKSCAGCHGPKARMAGLDLHEASLVLRGSENGPVLTPGKSKDSLLLKRVREGSMPPGGANRLSEAEVAIIERWIDSGAAGSSAPAAPDPSYISTVT